MFIALVSGTKLLSQQRILLKFVYFFFTNDAILKHRTVFVTNQSIFA